MTAHEVQKIKHDIKRKKINSWQNVHDCYRQSDADYSKNKLIHAYTSLLEIENITSKQLTADVFKSLLEKTIVTKTWMSSGIYSSRAKDYENPFRKMAYENKDEMNAVIGKLEDNQFIQNQLADADKYKKTLKALMKKIK
jgi:hypothetical protein